MSEHEANEEAGLHDTRTLEALLFVSDEPLTSSVLAEALDVERRTVEALCDRLQGELEHRGSGLVLRNVAGGWRLYTHPDTAAVVEQFVLSSRQARLTRSSTRGSGRPSTRLGCSGSTPFSFVIGGPGFSSRSAGRKLYLAASLPSTFSARNSWNRFAPSFSAPLTHGASSTM